MGERIQMNEGAKLIERMKQIMIETNERMKRKNKIINEQNNKRINARRNEANDMHRRMNEMDRM